jgi:hypothetical protein
MAQRLHENGVYMGHRFVRPDPSCPTGFYEDADFVTLNKARLAETIDAAEWRQRISLLASTRREIQGPWGWKDPRTCEFIADIVQMFPDAIYIRCRRPRGLIIASHCRWYAWDGKRAAGFVDRREALLDEHLPEPYAEVWIGRTVK